MTKLVACYDNNNLTLEAPNTTKADFANSVDPDETAHKEPSHLDLQHLHFSPLKVFGDFLRTFFCLLLS